ncbi:hypothetical protein Pfo_028125 [Paulownia fortunei]|nr:hypothetical protein Pfo_028125 [Paulownia fortunei]
MECSFEFFCVFFMRSALSNMHRVLPLMISVALIQVGIKIFTVILVQSVCNSASFLPGAKCKESGSSLKNEYIYSDDDSAPRRTNMIRI